MTLVDGAAMRRRGAVIAGAVLLLTACTPSTAPGPSTDDATIAAQTPSASPAPAAPPDRAELSQRVLDRLVQTPEDGPGCAAAVGHQGTVVWQGARRMADVEVATPISESTIFDVGSVTKQFVAASILMLAAENKLDLDDPVSEHVDGLPVWGDDVTIGQLIHHTSGTGTVGGRALLDAQLADPVEADPGDAWRYAAGIGIGPDGSLDHTGGWEGFRTIFVVSADRDLVIAVACNLIDLNFETIGSELTRIWTS